MHHKNTPSDENTELCSQDANEGEIIAARCCLHHSVTRNNSVKANVLPTFGKRHLCLSRPIQICPLVLSRSMASVNAGLDNNEHSVMDHILDMRSDTVTLPTPSMRKAMAEAVVGDDVFREDPTMTELERRIAEITGMDAALFVCSGTMGNLLSIMVHCQGRGIDVIVGSKSHIHLAEQGGLAQFGGVYPQVLPNLEDGTMDLALLEASIRDTSDFHFTSTKLICVENTHNFCGGVPLPLDFLQKVRALADSHRIAVHMDGARLFNAAEAMKIQPSKITKYVDSVCICCSKGLGAPIGSVIAGTQQFIDMARRLRKALGGGLRQSGILAAAILVALDEVMPNLSKDHYHAKLMADSILSYNGFGVVELNSCSVQTNICLVYVIKEGITAQQITDRLQMVTEEEYKTLGKRISVKVSAWDKKMFRYVTHHQMTTEAIKCACLKVQYVLKEFATQS